VLEGIIGKFSSIIGTSLLIVMILGFSCVSGSSIAVHTRDAGSSSQVGVPLEVIFCLSIHNVHYI